MIESWDRWSSFVDESMNDDLLFYIVPLHDGIHSAINRPSLLFIRNLSKDRTYCYAYSHPDIKTPNPVNHGRIVNDLNRMRGIKWAVDKKSFLHFVPIEGVYDVGFVEYLLSNDVFDIGEFETSAHKMLRNRVGSEGYGRIVPMTKHLEMFSELSDTCARLIKKSQPDDAFKKFNEFIIEPLSEIERNGLAINPNEFRKRFGDIFVKDGKVYTQYYFYTSTGRPSNRFGGINFAALNKEDGTRRAFVSRFGEAGRLVLIDYSAFHPRIISWLTGYNIPTGVDIYRYLATLYFNKENVDDTDVADAKQITFRQLFGGVEDKYSHIKYLSHLKDFINYNWSVFKENGYVETSIFKRKITKKHIQEPKPATVFNYLLQAVEGEISIPVLGKVNEFLRSKQTKAVLYVYDSILFDYCFDDGPIMTEIQSIMGVGGKFPMKVYTGNNYHDMELYQP